MKAFCAVAVIGLTLAAAIGSASAQPYGRGYDYEERGPRYRDRDYQERGPRYRGRDYEDRERGPRRGGGEFSFDEREYLRCNPDVRAAVARGQFPSGFDHYRGHGRREG